MIAPGRQLGGFEVLSMLGAGGMGEVYLAHDRRLGRDVALKVLPEAVSTDSVRLARFEAEARTLAALTDSGIAAIYGVEESGGVRFLVLELVPGDTLADRLRVGGPLPLPVAIDVGRQIAAALEAAHRKGIIHRDLKSSNIKVTPNGVVKLLDFGLAKAVDASVADAQETTWSDIELTAPGAVLGTAAYMSPEQARGYSVDHRTDIWSFGCVLYEALTGHRLFSRATVSDTIAAVLGGDIEWGALPRGTPPSLRRLLERCLERDRQRRLGLIADARIDLEDLLAGRRPRPRSAGAITSRTGGVLARRGLLALAGAALTVAATVALSRPSSNAAGDARPRPRLQISLPSTLRLSDLSSGQTTLALSHDGTRLVFAAGPSGGRRLYDRPLAELEARPIAGTEGGDNPFLSPDGRWVGFDVEGRLQKVRVEGGQPIVLSVVPSLRGASWGRDGTIVVAPSAFSGLVRISAEGGPPEPLTSLIADREVSHRWPHMLPDGKSVLFSIMTANGREEERIIAVVSLATGERQQVLRGGTAPHYLPTGHLLYARGGGLQVAAFDGRRLAVTSPSLPVLDSVLVWAKTSGAAYFDVSTDGTLVYMPGLPQESGGRLLRANRAGKIEPLPVPARPYLEPALSPDGNRLAVTISGATDDIWIYEMVQGTWTRLTNEGENGAPAWSPDGARLVFTSSRRGTKNIFSIAADGSGEAVQLTHSRWQNIVGFAPDGKSIVFTDQDATTLTDIWRLSLEGDASPQPLLVTPAIEHFPAVSPDGRWMAYTSTESRREEVYVRAYPGPGPRWLVSREGGTQPVWSADRHELFYRNGERIMVVPVTMTAATFTQGAPRVLFSTGFDMGSIVANYTVSPDGQRFVLVQESETLPRQIVVVPGWVDELRARLP